MWLLRSRINRELERLERLEKTYKSEMLESELWLIRKHRTLDQLAFSDRIARLTKDL